MVSATLKILVRTIISVFVLVVLSGLILVAALSRGPLSLSFAGPYINQVLADQYPDIKLGFDELDLLWDSRDKNLVFGVTNVSVTKETDTIAVIPAVTVTFSSDALFKGKLAPSGLEFTGLKVLLTRTENGGVNLGYSYGETTAATGSENELAGATVDAIHKLIGGLEKNRKRSDLTAYLERLEIYQSGFFIEDEKQDKLWRITSADLVLWRTEDGLVGRIQGDVDIADESINLVANAAYDARSKTTVINTQVFDFPISLIAGEIPELARLKGFDLPISGDFNLSLDSSFLPVQIGFNILTSPGRIDLPDLYKKPLQIKSIAAEGHSAAPFTAININSAEIQTIGPKVDLSGSFMKTDAGFGMSIEGVIPHIETNDIGVYWPYSAAVDGYNWVTSSIRDGTAEGTFRVELPPGALESGKIPDGAVEVKFSFKGLSADYFPPLPKVENISGNGILTEKQVHVFDMTGEMGGMRLPEGDAKILHFDKKRQVADVALKVNGENKDIFEFLDLKPLEFVSTFGVIPSSMKGRGEVSAKFVFPLRDDLTLLDVDFDAKGKFENVFIPNVYEEFDLSEGTLTADVTPDNMTVRGPAKIQGISSQVNFQSWFKGKKEGIRRYEVLGKLKDDDRRKLGFSADYLIGPVGASLGVEIQPNGAANGVVTLNLLEAAINVPDFHISKPIGVEGLLGAQIQYDGVGKTEFSNIRLSSGTIDVVGQAIVDQLGIESLTASRISFGENDLNLAVHRKAKSDYVIDVKGSVFDLRPYFVEKYSLNAGRADPTENPLKILVNVSVDSAIMDGGVALKEVSGFVDTVDGIVREGNIKARFTEEYGIKYTLNQSLKGRRFEFQSDHAGLLLQGMDLYDNVREGTVVIKGVIDDSLIESVAKGSVRMKDIRVVNAPTLGKILTIGSLGGIVDLLKNEGMTFASVEGPFTYENGVISTKDFRAVGSIGITVTGKIDQKNDVVDAFGTVIPSYTLNSILGNIPILGRLLVGRKGEGVFGFSYKVKGAFEDPKISVNPVSALAPGILRRMFFEPWDGKTDGDAPVQGDLEKKKDDKP